MSVSTQKPTIPDVLPLLKAYKALPGNELGGNLHIIIEDGNCHDSNVIFCIEQARKINDTKGVELGELLLKMSKTQRRKLAFRK